MSKFRVLIFSICLLCLLLFSVFIWAENTNIYGQNNDSSIKTENKGRQEIITARTLYSKTYRNSDGTDTIVVNATPQHFQDENGKLVDMDTSLDSNCQETDSDGENYGFQNKMNSFETMLPRHSKGWTKLRSHSGKNWLEFKLITGEKRNFNKNNSHQDLILANEVLPNCNLSYTVQKGGLKEYLILNKNPNKPLTFEYMLRLHGLIMTTSESDGGYLFSDQDGNGIFYIPRLVMWDKNKVTSDDINVRFEKQGKDHYKMIVTPSQEWLQRTERSYPVIIDPTALHVIFNNQKFDSYRVKLQLAIPRSNILDQTVTYNQNGHEQTITINFGDNSYYKARPYKIPKVQYTATVSDPGTTYIKAELPYFKVFDIPYTNIVQPSDDTLVNKTIGNSNGTIPNGASISGEFAIQANRGALIEMSTGYWDWWWNKWGVKCEFSVTYPNETMSPPAPTLTTLTPETYGTSVTLNWNNPGDGANLDPTTGKPYNNDPLYSNLSPSGIKNYTVQWSTDPTFNTNIGQQKDINDIKYTIPGLLVGTTYYFRVYASDNDGNPAPDNTNPWDAYSNPTGIRWSNITSTKCLPNIPSAFTDRVVYGDFDGDGKKDDIAAMYDGGNSTTKIYVWLSNGSSLQFVGEWWNGNSFNANKVTGRVVAGDFNEDGKDDIATFYDYGDLKPKIWVFQSNGSSFIANCWWTASSFDPTKITGRVVAGDINKDHKDEIACVYDNGNNQITIWVWQANGSSFSANSWWSGGGFDPTRITNRVVCGDFNGDGSKDIAGVYDYGTLQPKIWIFQSTGSSFNSFTCWWTASSFDPTKITDRVVSGDFDGNGKDDIAAFYDYGNNVTKIWTWLSSGGAFSPYDWWNSSGYNVNQLTGRVVCGDFDGDTKKDDIAGFYDYGNNQTTIHVWLSNTNSPFQYGTDNGWFNNKISKPVISSISPASNPDGNCYYTFDRNPIINCSNLSSQKYVSLYVKEILNQPKVPVEYPMLSVQPNQNAAQTNWNLPDGDYLVFIQSGLSEWSNGVRLIIENVPPVITNVSDSTDGRDVTIVNKSNEPVKIELYWGDSPDNLVSVQNSTISSSYLLYDSNSSSLNYHPLTVYNVDQSSGKHYFYKLVCRDKAGNVTTTPIYNFGKGPGNSVVNADVNHYGLENYWNYQTVNLGRAGTANVNLNNGNLVCQATDFSLPGRGLPLTMTRYYNSLSTDIGMLGTGWRTSLEVSLIMDGSNVIINDPDGSRHKFTYTSGSFTRPLGDYRKVFVNGTGYKVTDKTGMKYYFGAPVNGIAKLNFMEDRFGNILTFTYTNGQLTSIQEPAGLRKATFSYKPVGSYSFLHQVTFSPLEGSNNSRYVIYDYSGLNLGQVRYPYDGNRDVKVTYNYLPFLNLLNSSEVFLTNEIDSNLQRNVTTFIYKSGGRSIGSILTGFNRYREDFPDYSGAPSEKVSVVYIFDYDGNKTTVTDPRKQKYVYQHDPSGWRQSVLMPLSTHPITYVYDSDYNLSRITQNKSVYNPSTGSEAPQDVITEYNYDPNNGNLESVVADKGYKNLTTTITYESNHNGVENDIKSITDPRGKVNNYITNYINEYDPVNGKLLKLTIDPPDDYRIVHVFNQYGERVSKDVYLKTDLLNSKYHFSYGYSDSTGFNDGLLRQLVDGFNNTVTYDYTVYGERKSAIDANKLKQEYTIDPYTGNLVSVPTPIAIGVPGTGFQSFTLTGPRYGYNYDINGNKLSETDAKNHTTIYDYDALNHLYRVTSPYIENLYCRYQSYNRYDENGNLLQTLDYDRKCTNYEYDALNRKIKTKRYDGSVEKVEEEIGYDEAGRVKWRYDGKRNRTEYFYDSMDNLLLTKYYIGETNLKYITKYTYDENGNVTKKEVPISSLDTTEDGKIIVTNYQYDNMNKPKSINIACADTSITKYNQITDYTYEAGQLKTMTVTVPGGSPQTYTYNYDKAERLDTLIRNSGTTKGEKVKFDYYPGGQRMQKRIYKSSDDPEANHFIKVDYNYDVAYRLRNLDYTWGSYYVKMGYEYNEIDKIINNPIECNTTVNSGTFSHPTQQYLYDELGRLTESNIYGIKPGYIHGSDPSTYRRYQKTNYSLFDANGNPKTKIITSFNGTSNDVTTENTEYNWLNQLDSKSVNGTKSYIIGPFTYDDNGNEIKEHYDDGRPDSSFTYGLDSQLLKSYSETIHESKWRYDTTDPVDSYNKSIVTNTYEFGGKLLSAKKEIHDSLDPYDVCDKNFLDYFYYSHDGVVADQVDNSTRYFTRFGRELICANYLDASKSYFYIQNLRGDVIMLVNTYGFMESVRDYDVNGQLLSEWRHTTDPFGFTGGLDSGNSLWKLGARFYDSSKSAFIQQDRYMGDPSDPLSLNRYIYCNMDPVNYVDPTGFNGQALTLTLGSLGTALSMMTGVGEVVAISAAVVAGGIVGYKLYQATRDKLFPDPAAEGNAHTRYKRDPVTGKIKRYETYKPQTNPNNPNPTETDKRYDGDGDSHYNKETGENVDTPHVHDPNAPGGVRPANPDEIPN